MSFEHLRERFVERRRSLGLPQADVAQRMGTTQSAVSDLENGRTRDPGLDTLARWARALDVGLAVQLVQTVVVTVPIEPRAAEHQARLAAQNDTEVS